MIIHSHTPKRKPRKPNAKTRALQASWEDILRKYDVKPRENNARTSKPICKSSSDLYPVPIGRSTNRHIGSVDTGVGVAPKKAPPQYTGDAMIGIGQLHKSNAIPVFSQEEAIDISKMRRG
jgi:hypothetical protein